MKSFEINFEIRCDFNDDAEGRENYGWLYVNGESVKYVKAYSRQCVESILKKYLKDNIDKFIN